MVEIKFYKNHEDTLQNLSNKRLMDAIIDSSEVIAKSKYNTSPANWIITSPEMAKIINNTLNED